jgi:hypothetical protein
LQVKAPACEGGFVIVDAQDTGPVHLQAAYKTEQELKRGN